MEKYRRVERAKSPGQTPPNQVRITAAGKVPAYVDYAVKLLQEVFFFKLLFANP